MAPLFQQPSREKIIFFTKRLCFILATWVLVYGSTNWISSQRSDLYALYFPWELNIPLVPEMIFIYLSVYIIPLLHLFVVSQEEMAEGSRTIVWSIWLSGILFLLIPTKIGFPWPPPTEAYPFFFGLVKTVDLPHNLFPSLHITLAYLLSRMLVRRERPLFNAFCFLWFLSVCFSIILVYQHHLVDILGGLCVGQFCWHLFYFKKWRPMLFKNDQEAQNESNPAP